jgi:hypothetical protein
MPAFLRKSQRQENRKALWRVCGGMMQAEANAVL